jgi:hypothetical protein
LVYLNPKLENLHPEADADFLERSLICINLWLSPHKISFVWFNELGSPREFLAKKKVMGATRIMV